MSLEKRICTECGSNEINVVGATVFECVSCGTLLNQNGEAPKKPVRSRRLTNAHDEDPEFRSGNSGAHHESGSQFIKMVFWIAVITGAVALIFWLFTM